MRALVGIGTFARYGDKPDLRAFRDGDVAALQDPVPDAIAREFQVSTLANPIDEATLEVMVRESRNVPARIWRAAFDGLLQDSFCAGIPTIQSPVLLVWGSADGYARRADQDILRSVLPNARLLMYEEVGHALHWEQPLRFANDLADYVTSLGATDSNFSRCGSSPESVRPIHRSKHSMTIRDSLDHSLSGPPPRRSIHSNSPATNCAALSAIRWATRVQALGESPEMTMGHLLVAYLNLLGTEPAGLQPAREALRAAIVLPANEREQAHRRAVEHLVAGRWHAAGLVLEDRSIRDPLDVLALQVGHQVDFFTGHSRMLRDRIARALSAWEPACPAITPCSACTPSGSRRPATTRAPRLWADARSALEARDGWAWHAVAHVMEMQSRRRDGVAWLRAHSQTWSEGSFFCRPQLVAPGAVPPRPR